MRVVRHRNISRSQVASGTRTIVAVFLVASAVKSYGVLQVLPNIPMSVTALALVGVWVLMVVSAAGLLLSREFWVRWSLMLLMVTNWATGYALIPWLGQAAHAAIADPKAAFAAVMLINLVLITIAFWAAGYPPPFAMQSRKR